MYFLCAQATRERWGEERGGRVGGGEEGRLELMHLNGDVVEGERRGVEGGR